jgi:putative transposase
VRGLVNGHDIQISMDGTGCWRDNVRVEPPWSSVTYEQGDVPADEGISTAQHGLVQDLMCYN